MSTHASRPSSRRGFLLGAPRSRLRRGRPRPGARRRRPPTPASPFRKLTDADWKQRLPPASYEVLRHEDTERPGTSPLLNEHRKGTFACLGCGLPLFKSDWKFESGTGWPSFYTAIPGALAKKIDLAHRRAAHRIPLRPVPGPPGPRLRRRPQAHRPALLQQRRGAEVRPGLGGLRRLRRLRRRGRRRRRRRQAARRRPSDGCCRSRRHCSPASTGGSAGSTSPEPEISTLTTPVGAERRLAGAVDVDVGVGHLQAREVGRRRSRTIDSATPLASPLALTSASAGDVEAQLVLLVALDGEAGRCRSWSKWLTAGAVMTMVRSPQWRRVMGEAHVAVLDLEVGELALRAGDGQLPGAGRLGVA